jgi:hypothetical protein
MSFKHELQGIISGNGTVRKGEAIQAITSHVRGEKKAISGIEKAKFVKD